MKLHDTSLQDLGLGVQQIQAHIQNLCLEMKKLKQEQAPRPKVREEVWCRSQGHDKDHYPVSVNYVATGGLTPLRPETASSTTTPLWCAMRWEESTTWITVIYCQNTTRPPSSYFATFVDRWATRKKIVIATNC